MRLPRVLRRLASLSMLLALIGLVVSACTPSAASAPATQAASPQKPQASQQQVAASSSGQASPERRQKQDVLDGVTVGFTAEGYPYRGSPEASVTLVEYSDYLCPFCGRHAAQTVPALVDRYIKPGQVKWVFRDSPIASLHPTAAQGHLAAECVAQQGPVLFWQMHDKLFATQSQWNQLPDPGDYLAGLARGLGADMAAYTACVSSGAAQAIVDKGIADAAALGFNGTPSFQFVVSKGGGPYTLDGAQPIDTFAQWIDALLAGNEPPGAKKEEPKKAELPFWAKPEGLAPDPARPGFTMAGDPYRGDPKAPLVVVEFSDFQCPACAKHVLETQPAVDKQFVDAGQIMWVFKNLLLKEHPQAPAAATAAECAGDQGKFWEMHDLLFQKATDWSVGDPDPALTGLAGQLKLDAKSFTACLQSRKALERVLADMYDAQGVVSTTPTFIAIYGGSGTLLRGATSADRFQNTLQSLLDSARSSAK